MGNGVKRAAGGDSSPPARTSGIFSSGPPPARIQPRSFMPGVIQSDREGVRSRAAVLASYYYHHAATNPGTPYSLPAAYRPLSRTDAEAVAAADENVRAAAS